jgi:hypothetical protein
VLRWGIDNEESRAAAASIYARIPRGRGDSSVEGAEVIEAALISVF